MARNTIVLRTQRHLKYKGGGPVCAICSASLMHMLLSMLSILTLGMIHVVLEIEGDSTINSTSSFITL
eukprot:1409-Heterococcus_DN1.PRE.1